MYIRLAYVADMTMVKITAMIIIRSKHVDKFSKLSKQLNYGKSLIHTVVKHAQTDLNYCQKQAASDISISTSLHLAQNSFPTWLQLVEKHFE